MGLSGGPTKDEVMAVALAKLDLQPGDRFMDIGCGTGKIAIHAARQVASVYAIDKRKEAIEYARREAEGAGVTNIEFLEGNAADLLPGLPRADAAFIGGSGDLDRVLSLLAGSKVRSIVVNAVKIDTVAAAISLMRELGIFREAVLVQVSHANPVGTGYMWKPAHPVAVIVGGTAPC
ncbi:MAG: precorrin-6Y C5,15-methyltransferase (decarboxylating) subunit CbiT [Methanolinea sp.]|nr:precorrin-6Y C5,15-methyltransferase (decarboxylating) subunit CbiT [Methanolinea sp.]